MIQDLLDDLKEKKLTLVTAESCTGGLLSQLITNIPGSSNVFECGFITYSNQSKKNMLNVSNETLEQYGAVSAQTAAEMAQGALQNSNANISVSITGIAGPDGGTYEKPVGTVYMTTATPKDANTVHHQFTGSREEIRKQSCDAAIMQLMELSNLL